MRKPEEILLEIGRLNHELVKSRELYNKDRTLLVINSFIHVEEIHYNLTEDNDELTEWVTQYVKDRIHITAKPKTIKDSRGTIYYGGQSVGSECVNRMVEVTLK